MSPEEWVGSRSVFGRGPTSPGVSWIPVIGVFVLWLLIVDVLLVLKSKSGLATATVGAARQRTTNAGNDMPKIVHIAVECRERAENTVSTASIGAGDGSFGWCLMGGDVEKKLMKTRREMNLGIRTPARRSRRCLT
ncbi:hypothetical protein M409DRAFT_59330 [Zasmidium cellare ATCC 36951]|uniref:Uncharacterized protein n=1 Tax=Zasmidium cellare ATCC 36951 TaxID=1080233 RepID=A0A6A6C2S1_ZASCE|nr:uncharacterized protein M409DRAFT_59330 [Zasmidium cellare ATCC 36951]KAF2161341.1 hypothetical protein M409DRAFT_59330 [Zasmidium cellare ATCC 36951]